MPAKSGKGGAQLKSKYATMIGEMTGPRTESAMAKVLSIGMTGAKERAPMEYGTLMNSAFRRIEKTGAGIRGLAGFSGGVSADGFNYALYLHHSNKWRPRPVGMKVGPSWNPNATFKYLERGFTDKDQRSMMNIAIGGSYKL